MKTTLALLTLCLAATPRAWASSEAMYPLYDVDPHRLDPKAKHAIEQVATICTVSEMSRMGPSRESVAACNKSVAQALELGHPAVLAALASLDAKDSSRRAISSLYDIVRRSGDLTLIETLVRALEREEARGLGNPRAYERSLIADALSFITYTELKGTPAIQWRAWANAHPNPIRSTLLGERLALVEVQIASGTLDEIVDAARFLGTQPASVARARRLLDELEAHAPLMSDQLMKVRQARWRLPDAPATEPQLGKPALQKAARLLPRS